MSHEIYYTSAPEGVRRGQQGFCTVATSAGIPKPLWDRMESVSGYRHPFGSAPGRSPVAWAHWLVEVGGGEVSVLSRLCDSGLDYTQRTNAFAHHLALEPGERAAAGPAWMVRQEGVMSRQWDGRVGTIARTLPLPKGDVGPAPCAAWQRMTGDAGWAGVLAETAVGRQRRPVCILFNAGHDLLPLIAEAIALLPVRLRWQATFNTYFTSAPGSAECAWRCCLADSPAAQEAMRRSGGSLVLDLTNPAQLGMPPASPWVAAARAGRNADVATPTLGFHKPAARPPGRLRPLELNSVASAKPLAPATVSTSSPQAGSGQAPLTGSGQTVPPFAPLPQGDTAAKPAGSSVPVLVAATPVTADALDIAWQGPKRGPRHLWIIALSALALAFIGAGTWLRFSADRETRSRSSFAPLPSTGPGVAAAENSSPENAAPVWPYDTTAPSANPADAGTASGVPSAVSATQPAAVSPAAVTPPLIPRTPAVLPAVAAPAPPSAHSTISRQAPSPAPPAAAPLLPTTPRPLVLEEPLRPPDPGTGIRDPVQLIRLPAESLPNARSLASLEVLLPGRQDSYTVNGEELAGSLTVTANPHRPLRATLVWHDSGNPALAVEVATASLEHSRNAATLQISWKTATLIRRPAVSLLTQAVLQNTVFAAADAGGGVMREISFKPPDPIALEIGQPKSALTPPPIPAGVSLHVEHGPGGTTGWEMSAAPEWESGVKHAADQAGWLLHFKGPALSEQAACEFELHIAPGWTGVQSNWAAQRDSVSAAETTSTGDLKHAVEEVTQQRSYAQPDLDRLGKDVQEAEAFMKLSDEQLSTRFTNRTEATKRLEGARQAMQERRSKLDQAIAGIMTRRTEAERGHGKLTAGVKAFDDVSNLEIVAELPGGVRAATFRLTH